MGTICSSEAEASQSENNQESITPGPASKVPGQAIELPAKNVLEAESKNFRLE